ncbi:hypothetical protein KA111_00630 [Candidatus Woesebacteria bacterium]|nr:hypothetical protein [Candidatus Woesebacteria bacterium]
MQIESDDFHTGSGINEEQYDALENQLKKYQDLANYSGPHSILGKFYRTQIARINSLILSNKIQPLEKNEGDESPGKQTASSEQDLPSIEELDRELNDLSHEIAKGFYNDQAYMINIMNLNIILSLVKNLIVRGNGQFGLSIREGLSYILRNETARREIINSSTLMLVAVTTTEAYLEGKMEILSGGDSNSQYYENLYMNYGPSQPRSGVDFRLNGVTNGDIDALAKVFVSNQKDGIMLDSFGQIANIFQHAKKYGINPIRTLIRIKDVILELGTRASEYQKRTLINVNDALSKLLG